MEDLDSTKSWKVRKCGKLKRLNVSAYVEKLRKKMGELVEEIERESRC